MPHLDFGRRVPQFRLVRSLALALSVLAFCHGTATAQETVTIDVFDFDFGNASGGHLDPEINVGDTIRWVWINGFHSTTSAAGQAESWDSGVHTPAFSFEKVFTKVGDFQYYCSVHGSDAGGGMASGMSGTIHVVQPVPEPAMALLCVGLAGSFAYGVRNRRRLAARLADTADSSLTTTSTPGHGAPGGQR